MKLYCTRCNKYTKHRIKLTAEMEDTQVCNVCSKQNGYCTLIKADDGSERYSREILWVEWNKDDSFKVESKKPKIGRSLLMSPFSMHFTWCTTSITELIEVKDNYVHFKTKNSEYKLYSSHENI